jgi:hypothetical protein
MRVKRIVLLGTIAAACLTTGSALAATATPVMTGLDNPRGLTFGKDGALYVAQAGKGGPGPCQVLRGAVQCYGPTGRISRLWRGVQADVVTGLPSYITTTGMDTGTATGPADVAVRGRSAVITIGWGENPALRDTPPSAIWQQFGHLAFANVQTGGWRLGADVSAYEAAANPDGGPLDSNPYGLLGRARGGIVLTDAGGNDLLRVSGGGDDEDEDGDDDGGDASISTLAVFPSRSTTPPHPSCVVPGFPAVTDSVPTSVTVGPDGAYYVAELTGVPFCAANANVYRVVPGQAPTVYCGGFTTITDHTWGPDGKLYVLQHSNGPVFFATPGNVVRVESDCSRTAVSPPLNRPGSIAFGPDAKLYVSINANQVATGQVVRIDP